MFDAWSIDERILRGRARYAFDFWEFGRVLAGVTFRNQSFGQVVSPANPYRFSTALLSPSGDSIRAL